MRGVNGPAQGMTARGCYNPCGSVRVLAIWGSSTLAWDGTGQAFVSVQATGKLLRLLLFIERLFLNVCSLSYNQKNYMSVVCRLKIKM
jgi:hypothetical protein